MLTMDVHGKLISSCPKRSLDYALGIVGGLSKVQGTFQGRIDEQIQMGKWLTGDRRPRIMTIHGSGGQGKTALARVAAERFAHGWPGGVWAMSLETLPTLAVFLAGLARFLGINPQESAGHADLERQIQLRLRRRRTLLILDNLETLDEAAKAKDSEALALVEFVQQLPGERTSLLCTSRHLLGWSGEQRLGLPGLAPEEGAVLFAQSASDRVEEIELSLAQQLSRRVDGHPLGLFLLGKAFNTTPITLSAFLAEHETYLLSAENIYIDVDHRQRKMFANFAYSVRWLSPELRDTLSKLWIFHAPFLADVAVTVLDPGHDVESSEAPPIENHLYALWQRGLLTREALPVGNESVYLYQLPPVMRPYIGKHLADGSAREELLRHFGEAYAELAENIYRVLVGGRAIVALALQCYDDLARGVSFIEDSAQGYYLLYWGWILYWLGDRHMGIAVTEQALERAEGHDRVLEGRAQHNLAMISSQTGHPFEALRLYEQALVIGREVGDRAGEAATLVNIAVLLYQDGQQEAIANMGQALDILRATGLPQDAAGQTLEMIERALQAMRDGTFAQGQPGVSSMLLAEHINTLIGNTVAVMTTMPERRAEWRARIVNALADAQQHGTEWQIEAEFFTATLAILDGGSPSLASNHPYAAAIAAIQNGIANGGLEPNDEDEVSEGEQALEAFIQACVAALRSKNPQEKITFMQQLTALQAQAPDDEMKALFQVIQLALSGGDLAHLGDTLTGLARKVWEVIVAGVQQDDTPLDTPDTSE